MDFISRGGLHKQVQVIDLEVLPNNSLSEIF